MFRGLLLLLALTVTAKGSATEAANVERTAIPFFLDGVISKALGSDSDDSVIATWGSDGVSLRKNYESWRNWKNLEDSEGSIREFAYLEYLARQARELDEGTQAEMVLNAELAKLEVLATALADHVAGKAAVSEAEAEEFILAHKDELYLPAKYRLANIYVRLGESDAERAKARKTMANARERLLAGESFRDLALEVSQSQTRFRGGAAGRFALDDLPEPVAAVVKELKPGELSEVIENANGLMLIRLEGIDPAVQRTPEQVNQKVRKRLTKRKANRALAELEKEMTARAQEMMVNDEELRLLLGLQYPDTSPNEVTPEQRHNARSLLTEGRAMAEEAIRRGLDQEEGVALALRWAPLQKVAQRVLSRMIDARFVAPGPDLVRTYFDEHPRTFHQMQRYHLFAIHFGEEGRETLFKARQVVDQIEQGGMTFKEAAQKYSIHESAKNGGDMGWLSTAQAADLGIHLNQALGQMRIGEMTGVFHIPSGLWVFRLFDKQEPGIMDFASAESRARALLENEMKNEMAQEIREEILARLDVKVQSDSTTGG